MEIKTNTRTGGQCVVFQKGEDYYFAGCSYIPFTGMETMIFPCDQEGHLTSWTEVYCDRTGKSLEDCVKEFLSESDK